MIDVIVIGGGAAGFFSAISAKKHHPELEIVILEKTNKLLSKVKVSGGGRCNVTHNCQDPQILCDYYPRGGKFLRNGFHKFGPNQVIEWFKKRGVDLKTESDGRMFPTTDSSQTIIDCLMQEASSLGIQIRTQVKVDRIKIDEDLSVFYENNQIRCKNLIVTTGGSNKIDHYQWLSVLDLKLASPLPSLFTFNMPKEDIKNLMGLSVSDVIVKVEGHKTKSEGPILITHWGVSGPAILKLSSWGAKLLHELNYQFAIRINWVPKIDISDVLKDQPIKFPAKVLLNQNPFPVPKRLWKYFIEKSGIPSSKKWSELSKKETYRLIEILTNDQYQVSGKTTFKEEFVTCGGIALEEIHPKTMASKKYPNLYFAGEVLDIDGYTGGFNFQAAWTTGYIAGQLG